jgi:ABC-type Zn uptake system ZnuABC Zn-binding protein ZnuA
VTFSAVNSGSALDNAYPINSNTTTATATTAATAATTRRRRLRRGVAGLAVLALTAAACGADDDTDDESANTSASGLTVVTTVAPITSIAANVIGDRASIIGVVPEGTNSHTFEPSPSVAELMATADVVFINGLQLEEPTKELALANLADGVPLVELGDETIDPEQYKFDFSFPESEGKPNPHLWTDPTLVKVYADIIRNTMNEVDPEGKATYDANYEAFAALVDDFDAAVSAALDSVPANNRKLVTYHDAYAYFADTYGWTVVGAIQPADFGEPTPSEVVDLIEQIRAEGVPAIFGSEVFPSPVLEQVANETGAEYIDDLRDDDLPGVPGEVEHSWLGLMKFNFVTMTEVLGGDASDLAKFEVRNVAVDAAEYPQ